MKADLFAEDFNIWTELHLDITIYVASFGNGRKPQSFPFIIVFRITGKVIAMRAPDEMNNHRFVKLAHLAAADGQGWPSRSSSPKIRRSLAPGALNELEIPMLSPYGNQGCGPVIVVKDWLPCLCTAQTNRDGGDYPQWNMIRLQVHVQDNLQSLKVHLQAVVHQDGDPSQLRASVRPALRVEGINSTMMIRQYSTYHQYRTVCHRK